MKVRLTLAQFKRDASSGHMGLELIERYGKKIDKPVVVPVVACEGGRCSCTGLFRCRGEYDGCRVYLCYADGVQGAACDNRS